MVEAPFSTTITDEGFILSLTLVQMFGKSPKLLPVWVLDERVNWRVPSSTRI